MCDICLHINPNPMMAWFLKDLQVFICFFFLFGLGNNFTQALELLPVSHKFERIWRNTRYFRVCYFILHFRERTDKHVVVCSSVTVHRLWVTVRTLDELWSATRLESWQGMQQWEFCCLLPLQALVWTGCPDAAGLRRQNYLAVFYVAHV